MRLSYHPSFSQFTDNYLSTYYSGGVRTVRRLVGGPLTLLAGALLIIAAGAWIPSPWLRIPLSILGFILSLAGLFFTLLPLLNIFLVWLRRDRLFGPEALIAMEIHDDHLKVEDKGEILELPFKQIKTLQHRAESTWLLTHGDYLITIPRQDLISGDHDAFVLALEEAMALDEAAGRAG